MDIRSFFGGSKAQPKPKASLNAKSNEKNKRKSPAKKAKTPEVVEMDDGLVDSDEECDVDNRKKDLGKKKRLKAKEDESGLAGAAVSGSGVRTNENSPNSASEGAPSGTTAKIQKKESSPVRSLKDVLPVLSNDTVIHKSSSSNKKTEEVVVDLSGGSRASSSASVSASIPSMVPEMDNSKQVKPAVPSSSSSTVTPSTHSSSTMEHCDDNLFLDDCKFVFTGIMDRYEREDAEEMVKSFGGKVTTAVSGKTTHLVYGSRLENGNPVPESKKYKTAVENNVKLLNEHEFTELMNDRKRVLPISLKKSPAKKAKTSNLVSEPKSSSSSSSSSANNAGTNTTSESVSLSKSLSFIKREATDTKIDGLMWVDKYKPANTGQMVGSVEVTRKLQNWLKNWNAYHLTKSKPLPKFTQENAGAKAALLSGPPGIGKTTMATLVAKELGYEYVEMNASDVRNRAAITEKVADVVLSNAMAGDGTVKKRLVIMDEVDGMGSGDVGGIGAMIQVIKKAKSPIICICNDRMAQKMKPLVAKCFDLKVKRPTKIVVARRLMELAASEGLTIEPNAAEALVEQSGNDIRQAIHALQMWRASSTCMRYSDLKKRQNEIEKDKVLRQTPFDACQMILGGIGKNTSMTDRFNSFFIDYSLVPLLVQHNYIDAARNGACNPARSGEIESIEILAKAASAASDMDIIGSGIMGGGDQHWELLPLQGAMAVRVGSNLSGFQAYPSFPGWLGKNSTKSKKNRLTKEIVYHTALSIGQGFAAIRLEYCFYLKNFLLKLMKQEKESSAADVVKLLDDYGLSREDFMDTLRELQFIREDITGMKDGYSFLDAKMKAAFTREYNSSGHASQALVSEQGTAKGKKKAVATEADNDDDDEAEAEDKVDVGDLSEFAKKQRRGKKGKATAKKATKPPKKSIKK
jgi:replication factor C subunit 1